LNPLGWTYFTFDFTITAILLVPHYLYLFHHLKSVAKGFAIIIFVFMCFGSLGLFCVGIFNETILVPHLVGAVVAFLGYGLGAVTTIIFMLWAILWKKTWAKTIPFICLYGVLLTIGIIIGTNVFTLPYYKTQIYEWLGLIDSFIWIYGLIFLLPDTDANKN
jgi:hypothetical protein